MKENKKDYPLCKDCKWFVNESYSDFRYSKCHHPNNIEKSKDLYDDTTYVTGHTDPYTVYYEREYCTSQRKVLVGTWSFLGIYGNTCGKQGRWFEKRDTENVPENWVGKAGDPCGPTNA